MLHPAGMAFDQGLRSRFARVIGLREPSGKRDDCRPMLWDRNGRNCNDRARTDQAIGSGAAFRDVPGTIADQTGQFPSGRVRHPDRRPP
jgi:hypothetical protein